MRPILIVINPPLVNQLPRMGQVSKQMFVQTFIPKLTVETLDIAILRRFPRLYQFEFNAMLISPLVQRLTGKLRPLISSHSFRIALEGCNTVQGSCDIFTRYTVPHRYIQKFLGKVIHDGQAFYAPRTRK